MRVKMSFNFDWSEQEKHDALMQQRAAKATREFLKVEVLQPSQKIVPVETGDLKRSGRIVEIQYNATGFVYTVQYGSDKVYYALFVHDGTVNMAARKFLEKPALAAAPKYPAYIARALK